MLESDQIFQGCSLGLDWVGLVGWLVGYLIYETLSDNFSDRHHHPSIAVQHHTIVPSNPSIPLLLLGYSISIQPRA